MLRKSYTEQIEIIINNTVVYYYYSHECQNVFLIWQEHYLGGVVE